MKQKPETDIKAVSALVPVARYLDYRGYLQAIYLHMKEVTGTYSYIQLASDLGYSATNVVHLIIKGKRKLTAKAAQKVVLALGLRGTDRQYFETLVEYNNGTDALTREGLFKRLLALKARTLSTPLEQSQLEYYSEWYHPVIREMVGMPEFKSDPHWIAGRITPRILPEQARKSLELLTSLGLVAHDAERGRHVLSSPHVTTGDEVAGMAVVRYHQRTIELARESITSVEAQRRDVSSLTLCVTEETANRIKLEVQQFRKRLLALADEAGEGDQVYQLNIQLFPFTK